MEGIAKDSLWIFLNGLIALKTAVHKFSGDAFYDHILLHMMFFTTMLVLSCVFSLFSVPYLNTLAMHTTNQLTAHVANKGLPEHTWTTIIALPTKMENWWGQHLLQIVNVSNLPSDSWRRCPPTPIYQRHPAAMSRAKLNPCPSCVLLVCDYQRTRQRNIGKSPQKKYCQGFW